MKLPFVVRHQQTGLTLQEYARLYDIHIEDRKPLPSLSLRGEKVQAFLCEDGRLAVAYHCSILHQWMIYPLPDADWAMQLLEVPGSPI